MKARVGHDVARFMIETLTPASTETPFTLIWKSYVSWCAAHHAVPLASGVFYTELERLADLAGLPRSHKGGNVVYINTAVDHVDTR